MSNAGFFFPSASDLLREVKDMSAVLCSHQKILQHFM